MKIKTILELAIGCALLVLALSCFILPNPSQLIDFHPWYTTLGLIALLWSAVPFSAALENIKHASQEKN